MNCKTIYVVLVQRCERQRQGQGQGADGAGVVGEERQNSGRLRQPGREHDRYVCVWCCARVWCVCFVDFVVVCLCYVGNTFSDCLVGNNVAFLCLHFFVFLLRFCIMALPFYSSYVFSYFCLFLVCVCADKPLKFADVVPAARALAIDVKYVCCLTLFIVVVRDLSCAHGSCCCCFAG